MSNYFPTNDPTPSTSTSALLPDYLYHYTSYENLKKIFSDGKICASTGAGASHGPGVYLTALAPTVGRHQIGWNNKGGALPFTAIYLTPPIAVNNSECYLKLKRDQLALQLEMINKEVGRDIWKINGDIVLSLNNLDEYGFVDERGRIIAHLNKTHGKDGWSHSIHDVTIDCTEETQCGTYCASVKIRMELANGRYHEDIGTCFREGPLSMAAQLRNQAKQDAITDGLRRTAQYFGFPEDFGCSTPCKIAASTNSNNKVTPENGYQSVDNNRGTTAIKRRLCYDLDL